MIFIRDFFVSAAFLLIATYCNPLWASSVNPLDLPDLVRKADVIADATVTNLQSYTMWSPEGRTIHTRVSLSLNGSPIKGAVPSSITLDMLGGTMDGRRLVVEGVPQLQVGQRLIIFAHAPSEFYVSPFIGLDQGALRVAHDQLTNTDKVLRWWGQPVKETEPMTTRKTDRAIKAEEALTSAETVDHFLGRVKQLLNQ
jgi:hypothetical protein